MLTQFYPPVIGGEEQHVRNLAHGLTERGHTVSVATLSQGRESDIEMDGPVKVYRVGGMAQRLPFLFKDANRRFSPPLPDPQTMSELKAIMSAEAPDVVHAHNWLVHSYLPLRSTNRARLVMTLHDYSAICAQKRLWRDNDLCNGPGLSKCLKCAGQHYGAIKGPLTSLSLRLRRSALAKSVDLFVPVSNAVATGSQLRALNLPFEVIPNFIPDDVETRTDASYAGLRELPDEPFLLFVGDLSVDKGVLVLLESYRRSKTTMPLVLIGKSAEGANLPSVAGVKVLDRFPHAAVMEAWARSSVAIVPSIWADPCPTVAMEAMASGKPVIASDIGGLSDIVSHEHSGLLVRPGDVDGLSQAIQRLSDAPALRESLASQAKTSIRAFKATSVIPRIEGAYARVLGRTAMVAATGQSS